MADLVADKTNRVLDVGCGTGIAGRLFAKQGCTVKGVEPDTRMAEIARGHGLDVDVSTFESWTPPPEPFDLLISGHAWHWVDPAVGTMKAAKILRPGGRFAAFWNLYRPDPDLLPELVAVYRKHAPHLASRSFVLGHDGLDLPLHMAGLRGDAVFADIQTAIYLWTRNRTADEWVNEITTHSDHLALAPEALIGVQEAMRATIDGVGGSILVNHETLLLTAKRL